MTVVKNGDARLDVPIRVSARTDYAIRATAELAASENAGLVKAERLAEAQDIPLKFLLNILTELRRAGIFTVIAALMAVTDWPDRPMRSASPT